MDQIREICAKIYSWSNQLRFVHIWWIWNRSDTTQSQSESMTRFVEYLSVLDENLTLVDVNIEMIVIDELENLNLKIPCSKTFPHL